MTMKGEMIVSVSSMTTPEGTQGVSESTDVVPALKDRARLSTVQTRQPLGAVGRVASRVRTSGLLKVSSILSKARDEDEGVHSSPWGVGTAAITKNRPVSVTAEPESREESHSHVHNGTDKNSDVLDVSSPLSADEQSEHRSSERGILATPKPQQKQTAEVDRSTSPIDTRPQNLDVEQPRDPEASHPQRQIPSSAVRPKFTFRPSLLIEATSPSPCDNSTSPTQSCSLKFSSALKSPHLGTTHATEPVEDNTMEKDISQSSPSIVVREDHTADASCASKVAFHSETSISRQQAAAGEPTQGTPDKRKGEKTINLPCFGVFGRSKSRPHEGRHWHRGKAGKERPFLKLKLTRSKSQPAKSPSSPEKVQHGTTTDVEKQAQRSSADRDSPTQEHAGASKTRRNFWKSLMRSETNRQCATEGQKEISKSHEEPDEKRITVCPDFFARTVENGNTEILAATRTDRMAGKIVKGRNRLVMWKKASRKKEGDDTSGSDDEEIINETIVRSLALDDFINYQTRRKRNGQ